MKKLWKTTVLCLMAAVLVGGFFLPDLAFRVLDQQSAAVQSEELPLVTLDLTKELTLCQKAQIVTSALTTVSVPESQATQTSTSVLKRTDAFLSEIGARMGKPYDEQLFALDILHAVLFFSQDTDQTALFWEVHAYYNDLDLLFLIDDATLEILQFSLNFSEPNSSEMRQLAACLCDILGEPFEDAHWRKILEGKPISDELGIGEFEEDGDMGEVITDSSPKVFQMTVVENEISYTFQLQYTNYDIVFNIPGSL